MNRESIDDAPVAIIEFGATARGDADLYSDRDIFVLVEDGEPSSITKVRRHVAEEMRTDVSTVASYTVSTIDRLLGFGSLFLWHLKLEGTVVSDPDGVASEALSALRKYEGAIVDLARFEGVFEDVVEAFQQTVVLSTFECHVLFGIARNTCMILTTQGPVMAFGRSKVMRVAQERFPDLPLSMEVYRFLESGHLLYHRGARVEWQRPTVQMADRCIEEVRALLRFARARFA